MSTDATHPIPLDPAIAHHVPATDLLALVPRLDQRLLGAVRLELARHIAATRGRTAYVTWQAAWNDLTGASPTRPGTLRLSGVSCPTCHGKGFDVRHPGRNLARTGTASICGDCRGSRTTNVTFLALRASKLT